jgi:hypothetical protein
LIDATCIGGDAAKKIRKASQKNILNLLLQLSSLLGDSADAPWLKPALRTSMEPTLYDHVFSLPIGFLFDESSAVTDFNYNLRYIKQLWLGIKQRISAENEAAKKVASDIDQEFTVLEQDIKKELTTDKNGKWHWLRRAGVALVDINKAIVCNKAHLIASEDGSVQREKYMRYAVRLDHTRRKIKEIFNFECQICNERKRNLESHHLNAWSLCPEQRFNIDNGVCLCKECHSLFHKKYGLKTTKEQYDEFVLFLKTKG